MPINTRKLQIKLLFIFIFIILLPLGVFSQTIQCPVGLICLTQAEANVARDNALELKATKEKIKILENGLVEKDKSIEELKTTNNKNVSDLTDSLHKTEIALATTTGQLISKEAELTRNTAIIQAMIPMLRKKKIGIFNIF